MLTRLRNRVGGRTVVAMTAIVATLLLFAIARWIAGARWSQMLADLAH